MKTIKSIFILFTLILLMASCDDLERINKVRILNLTTSEDSTSVTIEAELIDNIEGELTDHGFCYSNETALPAIDAKTTETISLGPIDDPATLFSDSVDKLHKNKTYYFRAYFVNNGVVTYSPASFIRTPKKGKFDYFANMLYAISSIKSVVKLKGFVNQKRATSIRNVNVIEYGLILSPTSDPKDANAITKKFSGSTDDIITIYHSFDVASDANFSKDQKAFAFVFVKYQNKDDASDTGTFYSQPKELTIKK